MFCGKRSIAISFGSKDPQPHDVIRAAARLAVRIVDHLYREWDQRVELYNINVPMRADVESRPVMYTRTLPFYWSRGCLYAETGDCGDEMGRKMVNGMSGSKKLADGADGVNGIPEGCNGVAVNGVNGHTEHGKRKERHFKWAADLSDMKKKLQESEEGTDAHTVLNGSTR